MKRIATTVPSTLINWVSAPSAPSQTAKVVFAAPNVSDGVPTFRQLVASDIPTLAPLASPTFTGTVTLPAATAPTAAPGTNTTQVATTAFVQAATFGLGQTFTNVTGSRSAGTTFTNSTAKPIVVYVMAVTTAANGYVTAQINSIVVCLSAQALNASSVGLSIVVPPGATYVVTVGSATISTWYEYR
jgi:hypothetical protein